MEIGHGEEKELKGKALMKWYGENTDEEEPLEKGSMENPVEDIIGD